MSEHVFFAPCAIGVEELLAGELVDLGADQVQVRSAGVQFAGPLEAGYRACLWSRLAARVLLRLGSVDGGSSDALHASVMALLDWSEHVNPDGTLAVDVVGRTPELRHSGFAAQRVKDGICDALREACGRRPSVDRQDPDVRVNLHLLRGVGDLSIDLAGEALHRRGYRRGQGPAPLKETVAAALLLRAGWPRIASAGGALVDPLCGAGTILIEGAWMAADIAPGLDRSRFGLHGWRGHDRELWAALRSEAGERRVAGLARLETRFLGGEPDARSHRAALDAAESAGLGDHLRLRRCQLADLETDGLGELGLVATNPPYGERLGGSEEEVRWLYRALGSWLAERPAGWEAAVLAGSDELGKATGWRARKRYNLRNGPLRCALITFDLDPARRLRAREAPAEAPAEAAAAATDDDPRADDPKLAAGAGELANRLKRCLRQLKGWLRGPARTDCYRIYDRDLPEFNFALDRYGDALVLQEYKPPASVDPELAERRLAAAARVVAEVCDVPREQVIVKQRRRLRGADQYRSQQQPPRYREVSEAPVRLLVELERYLDTGLFLDHRPLRRRIGAEAAGKRFLNLFCYTASATVHAAAGGASETTSVDLNPRYLDWARRNLALGGFAEAQHELVAADVVEWLKTPRRAFDLALLDPPTFSNSKRTETVLDTQRDHVALIQGALDQLKREGVLYFSTNTRRFSFDAEAVAALNVEATEITRQTIDPDFERTPQIHRAWRIVRPSA